MAILHFATQAEAVAAVLADGGDVRTNIAFTLNPLFPWDAYTGEHRQPPPEVYLSQRQVMERLTPAEKSAILGACLLGNTNAVYSIVIAPTADEFQFNVAYAGDVFAQFVADGLLTSQRAAEILS